MAITVGSQFQLATTLPIDTRQSVADNTARDAIPAGVRYAGLITYSVAVGKLYALIGGITNADWTEVGSATLGTAPTRTTLTSTGSATAYLFTISTSSTVAVGSTYTNNGWVFTVLVALAAQTGQVFWATTSSGAPTATGTLTRATGSGTASITFTANLPLATYTTPANARYLKLRMVAGGGGGSGSSNLSADASAGVIGKTSVFGTNLLICLPGGAGQPPNAGTSGGAGGVPTINSPAFGTSFTGGNGTAAFSAAATGSPPSGAGAASPFGGAGGGAAGTTAGLAAKTNTGSGGSGGGGVNNAWSGSGGGAGAYIEAQINTPSATYFYAIGTGGAGGAAGTSGSAGGAGAAGIIIVDEYY